MFTALCVFGLVGLVVAFAGVCWMSAASPFWMVYHAINNSAGAVAEAAVALVDAIGTANN